MKTEESSKRMSKKRKSNEANLDPRDLGETKIRKLNEDQDFAIKSSSGNTKGLSS